MSPKPITIRRIQTAPGNPAWMLTIRDDRGHGGSAAYATQPEAMAAVPELRALFAERRDAGVDVKEWAI